jgi:hypothetical protein
MPDGGPAGSKGEIAASLSMAVSNRFTADRNGLCRFWRQTPGPLLAGHGCPRWLAAGAQLSTTPGLNFRLKGYM